MRGLDELLIELDIDIARKISSKLASERKVIALRVVDDIITVLALRNDYSLLKDLEFIFSGKVQIEVCKEEVLDSIINIVFYNLDTLLEDITESAIKLNVSDIHIEPYESSAFIRYRIDGKLVLHRKIDKREYNMLLSKIKANSGMDITEKRKPQDGKYNININAQKYDLRVSTIPLIYGEKMVLRILYSSRFDYSLSSLNFDNIQLNKLRKIIAMKNGLVIVNGPTGSGKSTTLYTILQEINNMEVNITTLEDPVEVIMPGINQMSLNKKADVNFANGLRGILRQDPDIIMVGEIRDEETASMAIRAALTGHKVYSTIHTKAPKDVFFRLEDMGIKSYLIKDSLVGIISQRLVRVLCTKCKEEERETNVDNLKIMTYKSKGCKLCGYSGYKGRQVVSAVIFTEPNSNIFQEISSQDNSEMKRNLLSLLKSGEITIKDYEEFIFTECI